MQPLCLSASLITDRLKENRVGFLEFPLQEGAFLLVIERGGRLHGPFWDSQQPGLTWVNPVLADPSAFREFIRAGSWNLGGERNWIAPEIQFITGDRADPDGSVRIPAQMDPGCFSLAWERSNEIHLSQDLALEARNVAIGTKKLHLETSIRAVPNPLRFVGAFSSLMEEVQYCGYEQEVCLKEAAHDLIMSELWNLVQLNPGGKILVPTGPCFELTDYATQPIDPGHYRFENHLLELKISGNSMYKIGLKAAHFAGRVGYLAPLDEQTSYLMVRNFFNNPSSFYIEEPAWSIGRWGDSLHVYNDGGRWGGFGELETHGQTIGGQTGKSESVDLLQMWVFRGPTDRLNRIALHLLGVG